MSSKDAQQGSRSAVGEQLWDTDRPPPARVKPSCELGLLGPRPSPIGWRRAPEFTVSVQSR